jgi:ketosteroid isomerase-like protein
MSQGNVDFVRRVLADVNRGGVEAALKYMDPEVQIDWSRSEGPHGGTSSGHDGFLRRFGDVFEAFERTWMEPHDFIPAGPHVVVPYTTHFRGRDGVDVIARATLVFTVSAGKIVSMTLYRKQDDALEAVGMRE